MRLRDFVRGALPILLLPAGVAAQDTFEGVISMQLRGAGERNIWVKNGLMRVETTGGGRGGAGTMIRDAQGRLLAVMDARRMYYVLSSGIAGRLPLPSFTATGRRETVAGYPCEYYTTRDRSGAGSDKEACITTELGFMPMGPAGPLAPADDRALRAQFRNGFVILKTVDRSGNVISEATKVQRTSVSDAQFAVPAGYSELKMPFAARPPS